MKTSKTQGDAPPTPPKATLARIRKLCLALPGATETLTWGHPNFRVAGKIFAGFGQQAGHWCIGVKVGKPRQKELLKDPRYLYSDYVGRFGWVSLILEGRIDWNEVGGVLLTSYRFIAPKRLLAEFEKPANAKPKPRPRIRRRR